MTDTELKLADTQTQLLLARSHETDEAIVRSCLNAFVALARSVTLVMQTESGSESDLAHWYHARIAEIPEKQLLRFFNERRVFTIHRGTIPVRSESFAVFGPSFAPNGAAIFAPSYVKVWILDGTDSFGLPTPAPAFALCEQYLAVLEQLVTEWLRERSSAA